MDWFQKTRSERSSKICQIWTNFQIRSERSSKICQIWTNLQKNIWTNFQKKYRQIFKKNIWTNFQKKYIVNKAGSSLAGWLASWLIIG